MPFIGNIFQALSKTRKKVANAFDNIIRGSVTSDSLEELEEILFSTDMGYDTVKSIVKKDGVLGLFGRGLKTRIMINGLQGVIFTVCWKFFEDNYFKH